jgi:hypothetical protein
MVCVSGCVQPQFAPVPSPKGPPCWVAQNAASKRPEGNAIHRYGGIFGDVGGTTEIVVYAVVHLEYRSFVCVMNSSVRASHEGRELSSLAILALWRPCGPTFTPTTSYFFLSISNCLRSISKNRNLFPSRSTLNNPLKNYVPQS